MKRIILDAYKKYLNKNSRKNKKNRIENLFYKLEELNNIKAHLNKEKNIRLQKITFDLANVIKEIEETEKELHNAISTLDSNPADNNAPINYNIQTENTRKYYNDIETNSKSLEDKNLSFNLNKIEK